MEDIKNYNEQLVDVQSVCEIENEFNNGSLVISLGAMICSNDLNKANTSIEFFYQMKFASNVIGNSVYLYKNVFISTLNDKLISLDYLKGLSEYLYPKFLENLRMDCCLRENGFEPMIWVLRKTPFYLSDEIAVQILKTNNRYFHDSQPY